MIYYVFCVTMLCSWTIFHIFRRVADSALTEKFVSNTRLPSSSTPWYYGLRHQSLRSKSNNTFSLTSSARQYDPWLSCVLAWFLTCQRPRHHIQGSYPRVHVLKSFSSSLSTLQYDFEWSHISFVSLLHAHKVFQCISDVWCLHLIFEV